MHHVVVRGMAERGFGRVVNVASDAGRVGSSGEAVYSACKGGIIAFTKTLARELARRNVDVERAVPWADRHAAVRRVQGGAPGGENRRALARAVPMRRIGTPEDYPGIIAFLLVGRAICGRLYHRRLTMRAEFGRASRAGWDQGDLIMQGTSCMTEIDGYEVLGLGIYFEDLPVGRKFRTIGRTLTEADLVNFIGVTGLTEVLFSNVEFLKARKRHQTARGAGRDGLFVRRGSAGARHHAAHRLRVPQHGTERPGARPSSTTRSMSNARWSKAAAATAAPTEAWCAR